MIEPTAEITRASDERAPALSTETGRTTATTADSAKSKVTKSHLLLLKLRLGEDSSRVKE